MTSLFFKTQVYQAGFGKVSKDLECNKGKWPNSHNFVYLGAE